MKEKVHVGDTILLSVVKPIAWSLAKCTNKMDSVSGAARNTIIPFSVLLILLIVAVGLRGYGRLQIRGV